MSDHPSAHATFGAEWLSLRERADHRARAPELAEELAAWWEAQGARRIVDLGSGTGSNLRYLAPRLPGPQAWTLVDHDPDLLDRVRPPADSVDFRIESLEPVVADLARGGLDPVGEADLVTASALLDLVSTRWLTALVRACRQANAAALLALSYDGTVTWSVPAPDDALVLAAVNRHQTRDKGTGGALGPQAAHEAERLFRGAGYRCRLLPSLWKLGGDDAALVEELVAGWAGAASEINPQYAGRIREWARTRVAEVRAGRLRVTVGHLDLLALPPEGE